MTLEDAVRDMNPDVNLDELTPSELLRLISDAMGELMPGDAA